jgi:hypothetical protein
MPKSHHALEIVNATLFLAFICEDSPSLEALHLLQLSEFMARSAMNCPPLLW